MVVREYESIVDAYSEDRNTVTYAKLTAARNERLSRVTLDRVKEISNVQPFREQAISTIPHGTSRKYFTRANRPQPVDPKCIHGVETWVFMRRDAPPCSTVNKLMEWRRETRPLVLPGTSGVYSTPVRHIWGGDQLSDYQ